MKKKLHFAFAKKLSLIAIIFFASIDCKSQLCTASFSYTVTGNTVNFSNTSSGNFLQAAWDFDDGNWSNQYNASHTFVQAGIYSVCLTITDTVGVCNNTVCQNVIIPSCNLFVSASYDSLTNSMTVGATGGSTPYTYLWSNGATGITITGLTAGTYCVTVTDANNCTGTACASTSGSGCSATFTYNNSGSSYNFISSVSGNVTNVLWQFGDGDTSSALNPNHTYLNQGTFTVCLYAYDSSGLCNQYCYPVYVLPQPTSNICGTVFIDLNGNGVQDSSEAGFANQPVYCYGIGAQFFNLLTDSLGHYNFNVIPGSYSVYLCPDSSFTITLPTINSNYCATYYLTVANNQTLCSFDFGEQQNTIVISGNIFSDANNNGTLDAGDYGIPFQYLQVGTHNLYTNSNGDYSINLPAGTYQISYTPNSGFSSYTLTTSGTLNVNASTSGNVYSNNNFGIYIPPGSTNLSVTITPWSTIAPGFPAYYHINVHNIGPSPTGATLTMIYDAALTFSSANPAQASNNTVTHTLTWNLPIIAPSTSAYVNVYFTASTGVALGTNILELVNVDPTSGTDIDLSNNVDSVHQVVQGSWDPNDKLVTRTNFGDPQYQMISSLSSDQMIEYTIHFQNTGTAPAVNVVVEDEMSNDLDANSYQLLATSHPCTATRTGNNVNYKFLNIMLPDSGSNLEGSNGSIKFRINSLNGLATSTVISDFAKIYFDYNSPVATNNTHITLVSTTGVNENLINENNLSVYPNPVSGNALITYSLAKNDHVNISIVDAAGRVCALLADENQLAGKHQLLLKNKLAEGFYFIGLKTSALKSVIKISVGK